MGNSMAFFAVSFLASIVGAICGIGGGVIIKPVLDMFGMETVTTISFLSGCTVLSMSMYSVGKSIPAKDSLVKINTGTPLAIGATLDGVFGKQIFTVVKSMTGNPNMVGSVQAACLAIINWLPWFMQFLKPKLRQNGLKIM